MVPKTTVCASPDFEADRIWLNGKEESVDNPRLANCLRDPLEICGPLSFQDLTR